MNRSILLLVITTLIYSDQLYAQLDCSSGRYLNEIFPTVTTTSNILYGNNINLSGSPEDLFLDVYEPAGDSVSMRPLIILAHGGSFTSGDKADGCVDVMCKNFTKLGYVTASINYRLGIPGIPFPGPDSIGATEAVWRATHDARAAVRFFRKDSVSNLFRIDTSLIFIGGQSAGAFMALHLAYLDEISETPSWIDTSQAGLGGGIEGYSGNPGYSSKVTAVINISGALGDTAWMKPGDTPLISFHGDQDGTVPFGTAMIQLLGFWDIMVVDGSSTIHLKANAIGLNNCFKPYWGAGHVPECSNAAYMDSTVTYTKHYLLQFVCNSPSICSYILPACAAPVAGFTVITSNLTANFTDSSTTTGAITWAWDFGDGSPVNNTQNPTHTYGTGSTYFVCLIVTDSCGSDTICQNVTVSCSVPTAGFLFTTSNLTASFIDASSGAVSWAWDFGDGTGTSTAQNPTYIYTTDSTYYVCLTVVNSCGNIDTLCDSVTVASGFCAPPVANFTFTDTSLTAYFTDGSVGANLSWAWDFGDGSPVDINQNPSHAYTTDTTYNVCLTVTDSCGTNTTCQNVTVSCPLPVAGFSVIVTDLTASFTDASTGTVTSWVWDFGDGSPVDNTQNPSHTYVTDSTYSVCLIATNSCGTNTICQNVTLTNVGVTPGYPGLTLGSVKLFPNPAVNELNIETTYSEQVIFNIYNVIGLQIKSVVINGTKKISAAELYTGMYIYQIADRNGVVLSRGKFNVVK